MPYFRQIVIHNGCSGCSGSFCACFVSGTKQLKGAGEAGGICMNVLLIEDEEKIARFIELELKHEGYAVTKAYDGRTGLEQAQTGVYDVILLDVMLPMLNGMEVLRRIRKNSDVPVILLTARDAVMDKVSGLDAGADDYITKPFAIEELLARIRVALKKRKCWEAWHLIRESLTVWRRQFPTSGRKIRMRVFM